MGKKTMSNPAGNPLSPQLQQKYRLVRGLQATVYAQVDPSADADLLQQLCQEEAKLHDLERQAEPAAAEPEPPASRAHGAFLGPDTTGLSVRPTLNMQPLPTGIYHLLDPETDPLLTVTLTNETSKIKRVCVKAFLEGLSGQAIRTVELERGGKGATLKLLPTLFPERAQAITEVQRATLHLIVEDLDGKPESHDTFPLVCLARTSSFNSVRQPGTGRVVDLSHYYGAWVTPNVEAVQERIRRAAEHRPERQIWGYQGAADSVPQQVEALYKALREADIVYVNSVIDYGAPPGMFTQRTRLPRESLALKSANCIDGTVLLASLLEGASLHPGIVLVPGHAFLAWETWQDSGDWRYLETTLIGQADFTAACQAGQRQYDSLWQRNPQLVKRLPLQDLRARGIWPME
jgi:hypothetical protein